MRCNAIKPALDLLLTSRLVSTQPTRLGDISTKSILGSYATCTAAGTGGNEEINIGKSKPTHCKSSTAKEDQIHRIAPLHIRHESIRRS